VDVVFVKPHAADVALITDYVTIGQLAPRQKVYILHYDLAEQVIQYFGQDSVANAACHNIKIFGQVWVHFQSPGVECWAASWSLS
jgi:hypothetical protein